MQKLLILVIQTLSLVAFAAPNSGKQNLNVQKKALNDFALRAKKAKDIAELFEKSTLHWHKGYEQMRDSGKGVAVPTVLVIKNGIEINADGKKISLVATSKVATFLINNQEYTVPTDLDLSSMFNDFQKLIGAKASLRFSLFPEAHAGQPSLGLVIVLGIADAVHDAWNFLTETPVKAWGSSAIKCTESPLAGSFEIYSLKDSNPYEQIISYDPQKKYLHAHGKKFEMPAKGRSAEQVERAQKTLDAELKAISEMCEKNPGMHYTWTKTPVEKNIEGITNRGRSVR